MAALWRRLPSFRRSVSVNGQQQENTDSRAVVDDVAPPQVTVWTVEEATSHIANLDIDSLRTILSDLSKTSSEVREALQKHAKQDKEQQQQQERPGLPHASHSMSKKRRAEGDLERPSSTTTIITNDNATTADADVSPPKPMNEALHTEGDKLVIEGQTGLVTLPVEELNEAAEGVVEERDASQEGSQAEKTRSNLASKQESAKTRKAKTNKQTASE